ncbi:MAG: aminotransferase class I/II-fold pyridoxal phosphate-dependent enzyme [Zymomonas mobilis]|uniref:8-amino-7-oxononanoate synthase n=1 Tax=Zymomonas mobilis TaxID=542 RepID=A0A542VYX0_ZYMMB|nr:aminotransferase class I/II-fold pyridoxal phosphate-dependent enzyme [Zymomonas mobilis]TQL16527.1 8-amino-7-oxononanoate synthase [Zymomonas mobilis]
MTRFDHYFHQALLGLSQQKLRRALHSIKPEDGAMVNHVSDSKLLCDFSSNDYLGLSAHPLLKERSQLLTAQFGAGARSSRLVSGTLPAHFQVESKVANFKNKEAALLFPSGWQANASVLPALFRLSFEQTGHKALVFTDRLNHASLHHGCAAAGVRQIRFRHNDLSHLAALLEKQKQASGLRFIITESVFSMDGDQADIRRLRQVADQYDAFLYVDEAHATGILGTNGQGLAGGNHGADLVMGTFSKALGCFGAYIAGSKLLCDWLLNSCSGFIYSTAIPPSMLGAMDAALDIVPTLSESRRQLAAKSDLIRNMFQSMGLDTGLSSTHIIPVITGDNETTLSAAEYLKSQGVLAIAIRPPTVPSHSGRLRFALTALHDESMLGHLCQVMGTLAPSILARRAK